jgi:hypothetical protein
MNARVDIILVCSARSTYKKVWLCTLSICKYLSHLTFYINFNHLFY